MVITSHTSGPTILCDSCDAVMLTGGAEDPTRWRRYGRQFLGQTQMYHACPDCWAWICGRAPHPSIRLLTYQIDLAYRDARTDEEYEAARATVTTLVTDATLRFFREMRKIDIEALADADAGRR